MNFNSIAFAPFLLVIFVMYWYVFRRSCKQQNALLLIASLIFLGLNDLQSTIVISVTGLLNFWLVPRMFQLEEGRKKKYMFYAGCAMNILVLSYFKYFATIYNGLLLLLAGENSDTLNSLLIPIGLSFYTFQLIAYWIDTYNESIEPEKDLLAFGLYIFYFPKLISGPIELAQNFLPQIHQVRVADEKLITDGLRQFLWGFFKKCVVSMHTLMFYKMLLPSGASPSSTDLILGGALNIIYIYCDFSGYSDMACGISKTFGIQITNNFANPFFARSINEFWKRWHISLTLWIMTYIFTPLSFILRRRGKFGIAISIIVSFLTVGIWHGLSLNYLLFGLVHGLFFLPMIIRGGSITTTSSSKGISAFLRVAGTFMLVSFTSLLFRNIPIGESLEQIASLIISPTWKPNLSVFHGATYLLYWFFIGACFVIEYLHRKNDHGLSIAHYPAPARWSIYGAILIVIFFYGSYGSDNFVYVQF